MGVDIINLGRADLGGVQGHLHAAAGTFSARCRSGQMVGIGGQAVTTNLAIDFGPSFYRGLIFLKDNDSGPLGHDEAVAILIEGAAGSGRVTVAGGQGLHDVETTDGQRRDGRFGSTGDHSVGVAALDHAESVANGVGSGRTGGDRRNIWPFGTKTDGYLPGSQVDDQHRDEEGRYLLIPAIEHGLMVFLDRRQPTEPGPDQNSDSLRVVLGNLETRIGHGHFSRSHGVLDEQVHLFDFFFSDELFGVEILDLSGNLGRQIRGIKPGNAINARLALQQCSPVFLNAGTQGGHHTETSYNDSTHDNLFLPQGIKPVSQEL